MDKQQLSNKNPFSSQETSSVSKTKTSLRATIRDQSGAGKTKIGELLSKEGYITSAQLKHALNYQKTNPLRLGSILIRLGYIDEETIVSVLSRIYNYPAVIISKNPPTPEALKILSYEAAKKYMAFPLKLEGENLVVTMAEPTDTTAVENLQKDVQHGLKVSVSSEQDIVEAYRKYYKISDEEYNRYGLKEEEEEEAVPLTVVDDFGSLVSEAAGEIEMQSAKEEEEDAQYLASDAPIIKLVNGILIKAINDGISDIHIEPFDKALQVRYRLDGALYKSMNLPLSIKNALTSRLKILSGLDIAERRVPQDGRIKMRLGKKKAVDLRVSTLPTLFGESVVMRILDQSSLNVDLTKMGFEIKTLKTLNKCISRPYGLLLVTGPTGSGKTTTLYSILNKLNTEDTKILTAEDPVEFNFRGINQVNVKDEVGMTFAAALRSFLRQDPDIIMVGEIRDLETAEIAIKAAMTGHLVFSTLHTNDCPSTIGRLIDIGIPSYMLSSAVTMVLSQRLARRLCQKCKVLVNHYKPDELESMGFSKEEIPNLKIYGPKGCPTCKGTGYKGRVGLYELMEVTDEVAKAINANVPEEQLRKTAMQEGMLTLRDAGLTKIREGIASVEEVLKRTTITKEALPAYLVNPDVERYEDKDVIIREGNKDIDFFKLIQGALIVVKGGKKIAEIVQPGEYFGEMSAITGEPRSASIISKGRSIIKRFPGDKIYELIEKHPDVAKHLFEVIASRLHQADKVMVKLIDERKKEK
ncbi:MAG: type IV-A pilus assembly ATPase PilB [Proteobacteria bacterium]|nr:type IV-A pilus assembly ATPase PilB [Pseudomonadota bacterium]MBU4257824.1 type IV-A pilus assembly ATPase PilB [Pseudomonadota bacterium]MBU4288231.1 type IV-A pilus assembly ATPase PilB [Pseudomonadota bacterium]MBU4414131.1 type IV-A pilus assembly ATPase PilB [Pseudomonadota bacterium]MCG2757291.1 type IV-A pilus assembly ATPase PilB [Desulfobacteraceae bacterium]